jgi:hypothetical protein
MRAKRQRKCEDCAKKDERIARLEAILRCMVAITDVNNPLITRPELAIVIEARNLLAAAGRE